MTNQEFILKLLDEGKEYLKLILKPGWLASVILALYLPSPLTKKKPPIPTKEEG